MTQEDLGYLFGFSFSACYYENVILCKLVGVFKILKQGAVPFFCYINTAELCRAVLLIFEEIKSVPLFLVV